MVLAAPSVDALDDEQPLAGLHERKPPRLENERLGAPRRLQPPLELTVLGLEPANLVAARAVLEQAEAQARVAKRAQEQIDVSARAGVATSLDLQVADQQLFQAQSAQAQARASQSFSGSTSLWR